MTASAEPPRCTPTDSTILAEVRELFRALDDAGIVYCHWKSNEHLDASLRGLTDLDVLVARGSASALAGTLAGTSFRHMRSLPHRAYPGIESYVGMDYATGTLLHLHLHYQLTVGERYLKSFHLPWEERALSTRVLDVRSGVHVADPHLEVILLLVRAGLKVRLRERLRAALGRGGISSSMLRELRWLAQRVVPQRLESLSRELLGERAAGVIVEMSRRDSIRIGDLLRLVECADPPLRTFRTYSAPAARVLRWQREARQRLGERLRRRGRLVATRRLLPDGGMIVALLGVDGCGKSTIAADLRRWLSGLVDVVPIYLGTGSGSGSLPRHMVERGAAAVRRVREEPSPPVSEGPRRGRGDSRLRTLGEILWIWTVSRERKWKAATARRARERGMIVICDRLPQSRVAGNDGPQFAHWQRHGSALCRAGARLELAGLRSVERLEPNLAVRLLVPAEVAMVRKPDTPSRLLSTKLRGLELLKEAGSLPMVDVDASRPYDEVLLEVKRHVWDAVRRG